MRKKKQPRLKLGRESELVRGSRGPAGRLLPALDPGLPGAIGHQRQHQEADQEPYQVYQRLLENGRGVRSWRLPSRPD